MSDPVDVKKLDAQTLAKHLANPDGPIGVAVTASLNKTNAGIYAAALAALALQEGDRILEIGFGNGREIDRLLSGAPGVLFTGVDISHTMIAEATACNAAAVEEGRVTLRQASSSALPFADSSFDKALAPNTIYFWENPLADLRQIRRVIRMGGRLVLAAIAPSSTKNREHFRFGFRFYEPDQLRALFGQAGFANAEIQTLHDETVSAAGEKIQRDYFIVTGH